MQATQTVPQVVPFRQPTEIISQAELTLLLSLRNRLRQVEEQVAEAEQSVKARLEVGAQVEPGTHLARLEEHWRRNVGWKDVVIRLADRLGLNGEAYCANVLEHTKPTRTVSLFLT